MNSQEYLEKMTNIQQILLEYIDDEDSTSVKDKFENFQDLISKYQIQDNKHEFKSFLYLLLKISNNHHRCANFFDKMDIILTVFKDYIVKYFSNSEIFHIFKSNKRILLFLKEEKILNFDEFIVRQIIHNHYIKYKYPQYFQPEIEQFKNEIWFPEYDEVYKFNSWILDNQKEIPDDFYEKRKIGENDNIICSIIRKDLLDEFIVYVNEKNYQLESTINQSIYETNNYLLKKNKIKLIEYAAFFGSIKIFKYLIIKNVSITSSIWYYGIHCNNPEIIEIIEAKQICNPKDEIYEKILKESIKCHHNEIAYYIQSNYLNKLKEGEEEEESNYEIINGLKYYNFNFISKDQINNISFSYLCKYDYYILVFIFLNTKDINIDINQITYYEIKSYIII